MAVVTTLGDYMVDDILPVEYRGRGALTKTTLQHTLVELAKKHPGDYARVVTALKRLGDEVATLEGISVGLDDVGPDIGERDKVLHPFAEKFKTAKSGDKDQILLDAQNAMLGYTKGHSGTMGEMVRSGGRGNNAQLMKIVGSPVLARDEKDKIVHWFIPRSYSEGLKPSDAWVAGNEARINAIKSNISVVEPGDLAKILINNMGDKLITKPDCGTHNGISMNTADPHIVDRFLARPTGTIPAGTLLTHSVMQNLPKDAHIVVRSPMTCEAAHGVCQKCQGLDMTGAPHTIGTNVGMRAAQALSEPLTQFSLNAKHGGRLDTGHHNEKQLEGIKGVRQLLEIPLSFLHKATLSETAGTVERIETAPQGGQYVWVGSERHYAPPDLSVKVKAGQVVTAGDRLTNGVPKPDEIVRLKGLGEGRKYLVDAIHDVYRRAGADVDRRHVETLAKSVLNHVTVLDNHDHDNHGFLKGDVVNYNRLQAVLRDGAKEVAAHDAIGEHLGMGALHFTAGTAVTPSMVDTLKRHGITKLHIAANMPQVEPFMKPASRTPLLNPDWMSRLAHRYLKESLVSGAHRGDVADLHGDSPVGAYASGSEFGQGTEGRY